MPASASLQQWPSAFLFAALFAAWIGFQPVFLFGEGDLQYASLEAGGGDLARQIAFAALFIGAIGLSWRDQGPAALMTGMPIWLAAVLMWCLLSAIWAVDPAISIRRSLLCVMVTISVVLIVSRMTPETFLDTLFVFFASVLLLNWFALLVSANGAHTLQGAEPALAGDWRGAHIHKNEAGAFAAVTALIVLDRGLRDRSYLLCPLLVILAMAFLVGTGSKTSLGLFFVAIAIGAAAIFTWRYRALRLIMVCVTPIIILAFVIFQDRALADLLDHLDDPGAFTGRAQIWNIAWRYFLDHPLLGAGYGSFWAIGKESPVFQYASGWIAERIDHAHNGYLNLLVQIGAIGLVLSIMAAIVQPGIALFSSPRIGGERFLLAAILGFIALRDLLEDSLVDRANPLWIVLVGIITLVARQTRGARSSVLDRARLRVAPAPEAAPL